MTLRIKAADFENKVRRIISAIEEGKPAEDTLVEIKSEWIKESDKAARRLAGHANAAKGEPLIWIFGVDEKAKLVIGVEAVEMEHWVKSVGKHFDGAAPELILHINIHFEDKTVVALYFDTSRAAPFVVKNPDGGYPEFEVPWRSGTRLRAAKREDLLNLLLPVVTVPQIKILNSEVTLGIRSEEYTGSYLNQPKKTHVWKLIANLYFTPQTKERIVIPHNNCRIQFKTVGYPDLNNLPIKFESTGRSFTIRCAETELIIDGPGSVRLESEIRILNPLGSQNECPEGQAKIRIGIRPSNYGKLIVIEKNLSYNTEQSFLANFFSSGSRWTG